MYEDDLAKDYLREAFMNGSLDITRDFKSLRGFVQLFAGEMEALIAVGQLSDVWSEDQRKEVFDLAANAMTKQSAREYMTWLERI